MIENILRYSIFTIVTFSSLLLLHSSLVSARSLSPVHRDRASFCQRAEKKIKTTDKTCLFLSKYRGSLYLGRTGGLLSPECRKDERQGYKSDSKGIQMNFE